MYQRRMISAEINLKNTKEISTFFKIGKLPQEHLDILSGNMRVTLYIVIKLICIYSSMVYVRE